jgi:NADH-quinone oxidoreductase subunit A
MTLSEWVPVGLYLLVALMIPAGMIVLGFAFGSRAKRPDVGGNKHLAFESGVSEGYAARQRFPIDFYLTAMLFIIFDIEMVFLYPLGMVLDKLGMFGLIELFVFVGILAAGYIYVWGRGALDWE